MRPLYDIVDNYIGIFYNNGDLVLTSKIIGEYITYSYGIISVTISLIAIILLLNKYKNYPKVETQSLE